MHKFSILGAIFMTALASVDIALRLNVDPVWHVSEIDAMPGDPLATSSR
jgi:hypothetical protein